MPMMTLVIEQFVQWPFVAALGLTLLVAGLKTENATYADIGGVLLIATAVATGT